MHDDGGRCLLTVYYTGHLKGITLTSQRALDTVGCTSNLQEREREGTCEMFFNKYDINLGCYGQF